MTRFLPSWLGGGRSDLVWLTPVLAVGDARAALSPGRLRRAGVLAVIDLQAETHDRGERFHAAGLDYVKIPVPDFHAPEQHQLEVATAWALDRMQRDRAVLVHCRMGIGRSMTVALATLLRVGYDLPTAYNLMRRVRPAMQLSESQIEALRQFAARGGPTGGHGG